MHSLFSHFAIWRALILNGTKLVKRFIKIAFNVYVLRVGREGKNEEALFSVGVAHLEARAHSLPPFATINISAIALPSKKLRALF
jgi:hypothetical protein